MPVTYLSNIISSSSKDTLIVKERQYITVDDEGIIASISSSTDAKDVVDLSKQLLIPSFTDLHLHASQQRIRGIGYDEPLEDWFKFMYAQVDAYDEGSYAETNQSLIEELWLGGVMCSSILTAVKLDPALDLMRRFDRSGMSAKVGKMNCDLNAEGGAAKETLEASIEATLHGIKFAKKLHKRVQYSVTPEFIPTCSSALMGALGQISRDYQTPVQMHFAEGEFDSKHLRQRYPGKSYLEVYQEFNLLHPKSLVIHGISAEAKDYDLVKQTGATFVHCATAISDNPSDRNVDIKAVLDLGIPVGYGSDIGGSSTLNPLLNLLTMRRYSKIISLERGTPPLTLFDAFRILTKNSGAYFGRYGVLEPGYYFSALAIDDGRFDLNLFQRFESFIYRADLNQISLRFHQGHRVDKPN